MFNKVLVPLDGSGESEGILPYVSQLARGLDIPMVLLMAIDRSAAGRQHTGKLLYSYDLETRARDRFKKVMSRLNIEDVHGKTVVLYGNPADEIVAVGENEGCDLIAMSTHGRNFLARGILGSVTDKVVHTSEVPVLTITPEKAKMYHDEETSFSRVMVPLDGSPLAESVLPYVEEVARKLPLKILLVRVTRPLHLFWMDTEPVGLREEEESMRSETAGYLEGIGQGFKGKGLDVESQSLVGEPAAILIELGQRQPHDLIAIATHGRSGLTRWALGSVAESLVRGTGDPVLIVPPGAHA